MKKRKRMTVNFKDTDLHALIKEKAKSIGKSQSRFIEEVLSIAMEERTNENAEEKKWGDLENISSLYVIGHRMDYLQSHENILAVMRRIIIENEEKSVTLHPFTHPYWNFKVEIQYPPSHSFQSEYKSMIEKNSHEIIRRVASRHIESLCNSIWAENRPNLILFLLIYAKVKCLGYDGEKITLSISFLFHCIPLNTDWIALHNEFGYLDFLNIHYRTFKEVATQNINPKYRKRIYIDFNEKIGSGGYFIDYKKKPTPMKEVLKELENMWGSAQDMTNFTFDETESKEYVLKISNTNNNSLSRRGKHDEEPIKIHDVMIKLHYHRDLIKINTLTFERVFADFMEQKPSQNKSKTQ